VVCAICEKKKEKRKGIRTNNTIEFTLQRKLKTNKVMTSIDEFQFNGKLFTT